MFYCAGSSSCGELELLSGSLWCLLFCGAQALGYMDFSSCSTWAHCLWFGAWFGLFLDQGSNSCPLHWQADSSWTTRKSLLDFEVAPAETEQGCATIAWPFPLGLLFVFYLIFLTSKSFTFLCRLIYWILSFCHLFQYFYAWKIFLHPEIRQIFNYIFSFR